MSMAVQNNSNDDIHSRNVQYMINIDLNNNCNALII